MIDAATCSYLCVCVFSLVNQSEKDLASALNQRILTLRRWPNVESTSCSIWLDQPIPFCLGYSAEITRRCTKDSPANTKHLYNICTMLVQRRRRWTDVVQMLCKCFVFAGDQIPPKSSNCFTLAFQSRFEPTFHQRLVSPGLDMIGYHSKQ